MDWPVDLENWPARNPFSHRNYPMRVGFNTAEDKYAFGGWSNAEFALSEHTPAAFDRCCFSFFDFRRRMR
jgi:hypothetical protein